MCLARNLLECLRPDRGKDSYQKIERKKDFLDYFMYQSVDPARRRRAHIHSSNPISGLSFFAAMFVCGLRSRVVWVHIRWSFKGSPGGDM